MYVYTQRLLSWLVTGFSTATAPKQDVAEEPEPSVSSDEEEEREM